MAPDSPLPVQGAVRRVSVAKKCSAAECGDHPLPQVRPSQLWAGGRAILSLCPEQRGAVWGRAVATIAPMPQTYIFIRGLTGFRLGKL